VALSNGSPAGAPAPRGHKAPGGKLGPRVAAPGRHEMQHFARQCGGQRPCHEGVRCTPGKACPADRRDGHAPPRPAVTLARKESRDNRKTEEKETIPVPD